MSSFLSPDYASEVASTAGSVCSRDPLNLADKKRELPRPRVSNEPSVRWPGVSGLTGLDAYSRHKKFINDYVLSYGKDRATRYTQLSTTVKTDRDILRENHRFLRSETDDDPSKWEARMAKKYYDKLFKEYCIADMSLYKRGKIGLRWRTQQEVFEGHGQFRCGNQICKTTEDLQSFEMKFCYKEQGEAKSALVKLRVCPDCAIKLNYRKLKREEKARKKEQARARKRRRSSSSASDSSETAESINQGRGSSNFDGERGVEIDIEIGDWKPIKSKTNGKTYWYNIVTGATQWSRPAPDSMPNPDDSPVPDQQAEAPSAAADHAAKSVASEIWASKPKELTQEEDEHEEYFEGLFL